MLNCVSLSIFTEGTLQLNPDDRPTVNDILDRLKEIAEARQIKLDTPLKLGQPVGSHPSSPGYFLNINFFDRMFSIFCVYDKYF